MIVKNEEEILEKSLNSIKDAVDEIIIVDTGSSDTTVSIAKKFTDKVYFFKWIDDFSAARNYCSQFAKYEYILRWDADQVLKENSLKNLLKAKSKNFDNADVINFTLNLEFNEKLEAIKCLPEHFFIYKNKMFTWKSPIHNYLISTKKEYKTKSYHNIQVDHLKDKVIKAKRYHQTNKIILSVLAKEPNNCRLRFHYCENLYFQGRYEECLRNLNYLINNKKNSFFKYFSIEIAVKCFLKLNKINDALKLLNKNYSGFKEYKPFKLLYADIILLFDKKKATNLYLDYLKDPIQKEGCKEFLYDYERFIIHPSFMLGKIYFLNKNFELSKNFLEFVIKNSLLTNVRQKANLYLNKLIFHEKNSK